MAESASGKQGVDAHAEYLERTLGVKLSGLRTLGCVAVEVLAFCRAGHCTAPDYHSTAKRPTRCWRSTNTGGSLGSCQHELTFVVDHLSDALLAAFTVGGCRAVYEMVAPAAWPTGHGPYAEQN